MKEQFEFHLPYFKQGDDLHWSREHATSDADALVQHAEMLEESARRLRQAAGLAAEGQLEIDQADTHMILVLAETESVAELISDGWFARSQCNEDENENYEGEDDTCLDCEEDEEGKT